MTGSGPMLGIVLPTRGVVLAGGDDPDANLIVHMARLAEDAGVDSVWVGDSLVAKPRLEPLAALAAVAASTTRVGLGTSVLLAALRHPVLLAQTAATVDQLSNGRLTLAMGVGGAFTDAQKNEWATAGVAKRTRVTRMEEMVEIMRGLWSGYPVTFHGKHFDLDEVSLGYRPYQRPGVSILLATHSGEGRSRQPARAARLSDGIISISDTPEEFAAVRARVAEEAAVINRSPNELKSVYYMTVNLDPDAARGREEGVRWVTDYYGLNFWGDRWGPYGDTEGVIDRIRRFTDAGADEVIVRFASYDQPRQMELFAKRVLPAFR
ncbi:MAG TPA: LLM class flavin-dependent oxidoreductase [Dehalococcoidia bacterium]|nr:LLM class flavin-dependent oxidoreductase [Dehalococcoidia bacterium]MDP7213555.1 LLM class flavin-dependent oxidoreductase [Dehalococcoidia bacterium]HJM52846.1 LLM class flavin-dependent oxidoreductase [Dehalococcoidia bacterium]